MTEVRLRLALPLLLVSLIVQTSGLSIMSVDVGSEFMKIAIVSPGVPMEIAINKESRRKTALLVSIVDGERYFGDAGLSKGIRYPSKTYMYLTDLLGKLASNPLVELYKQRFPYYTIEAHPDTGMVVFRHDDETTYSVEELMGMILENAKETAEAFTEQTIHETVITVPPYFNQAERRAMKRAAELSGLKVLQLMNDNTAVALNYGVFRRKTFNATAVHYMFVDVGATKTTASVVSYQLVKTKSPTTGLEEIIPQLHIKGVGFDRTLGGAEFQLRLRDMLVSAFNALKKAADVRTDRRAMAKLYKEAGRVKHVLSANNEHFAQVESLMEDVDFRSKVKREDLEEATADLSSRITKVIEDALRSSEVTLEEITEVILMGGGTRVPKIQEYLKKAVQREELGKSINTDEAGALGAVYQAAYLGKGYRVKKFGIKDANIYPIQVEFERVKAKEDAAADDSGKLVKRTLFAHMNPFPQKKVMTFNKHMKDFGFVVNYGDLSFLTEAELKAFGSTQLFEVSLTGVEDAHLKHDGQAESKGVKAHFRMDESGIFSLDKVESLFEKTVMVDDEDAKKDEDQSTLSKIGNTISSLFGSSEEKEKAAEKESSVEDTKEEGAQETDADPEEGKKEDEKEEKEEKDGKDDEKKDEEKSKKDEEDTKEDEKEEKKEEKDDKKDKKAKKKKVPTATLR